MNLGGTDDHLEPEDALDGESKGDRVGPISRDVVDAFAESTDGHGGRISDLLQWEWDISSQRLVEEVELPLREMVVSILVSDPDPKEAFIRTDSSGLFHSKDDLPAVDTFQVASLSALGRGYKDHPGVALQESSYSHATVLYTPNRLACPRLTSEPSSHQAGFSLVLPRSGACLTGGRKRRRRSWNEASQVGFGRSLPRSGRQSGASSR
ncbi:MAG: hypothetical protein ACE5JN_01220 [Candidatus Methylomirabilia bacterium]